MQNREPIAVSEMYGITIPENKNFVLVRMFYVVAKGKRSMNRTFTYYSEQGKQSAIALAKTARDQMLEIPAVQHYLQQHYLAGTVAGADSPSKVRKSNSGHSERGIQGLKNISITSVRRVLKDNSVVTRWDVSARAFTGAVPAVQYRSWGIRRHGLVRALWLASTWQAQVEQRQAPSADLLERAREDVLRRKGDQMRSDIPGDWEQR